MGIVEIVKHPQGRIVVVNTTSVPRGMRRCEGLAILANEDCMT